MVELLSAVTDYPTIIVSIIVGATFLVIVYISNLFKSESEQKKSPVTDSAPAKETVNHTTTTKPKKKQSNEKWTQKLAKQTYSHPWMVTSLKGHTGLVTDMDFSPNGKFLVTCAEDRAMFVWSTKDYKEHKNVRHNVELDHAALACWSPDSKAVVISRAMENVLEVYKVARRPDGWISALTKAITFPKHFPEETVTVGLGMDVNGRYMMSCSAANQLVVWDLKGSVLATVDTCLLNTYCAKVSPCGRFIAASGFTPDVKVWEVVFNKDGELKHVSRAFELGGHTSGVTDLAFSSDSWRMATVSKDGTWRVFNTNIEFAKGEDPHLVASGRYSGGGGATPSQVGLSPGGDVVAVASGHTLSLYNTATGVCDKTITNIYPNGGITRVLFDSAGLYVLTAGEKHVRVFHNMTGRRAAIADARAKLSAGNTSAATKERLETIIRDAESFLKGFNEPIVSRNK